jgi:hypothetical protein
VRTTVARARRPPAQRLHSTKARTQIREVRRLTAMRRASPRCGLGLGTLGCARARTHVLIHKKRKTTARRPELQNARLGATLASRCGGALRGVPRFGEQRCGKAPNYRERPTLRLGVAKVRGLHKCGAARRPFMENQRRTAARRRADRQDQGREATQERARLRFGSRWVRDVVVADLAKKAARCRCSRRRSTSCSVSAPLRRGDWYGSPWTRTASGLGAPAASRALPPLPRSSSPSPTPPFSSPFAAANPGRENPTAAWPLKGAQPQGL